MNAQWQSGGKPAFARSRGPLFHTLAYAAAIELLSDQKARLEKVIAENAFVTTTNRARRYLAKVNWWLAQPIKAIELAPQQMGKNGLGPAIDQVCHEAEQHSRHNGQSQERAA